MRISKQMGFVLQNYLSIYSCIGVQIYDLKSLVCASDHIPYAQLRTIGGLLGTDFGNCIMFSFAIAHTMADSYGCHSLEW